jgi:hypothetical protein
MKTDDIFRGILINLWNSRKFKFLTKDEKLMLLYIRTSPLSNLSRIYRIYEDAVVQHTGIPLEEVRKVLHDLSQKGWIMYDEGIVWDKDGLHDDPFLSLNNEKHIKSIQKDLFTLEASPIVNEFCYYYNIEMPYGDGYKIGNSIQERELEKEEKKKEREKEVEAVKAVDLPPQHSHTQKPPEITIPLMDGIDFVVTDKIASELKASFPTLDVDSILAKIKKLHHDNPKERKTRRGILPHLTKILQSESSRVGTKERG